MIFELIIFLVSFFLIFLLGFSYDKFFIKSYFSTNEFTIVEKLTIKSILGLLFLITTVATFYSNFTSLYLLLFVGFVIFPIYYNTKKKVEINIKKVDNTEQFSLIYLCVFLIPVLLFIYHQFLYHFSFSTPFYDFLFLSKISSGLINNGVESFYSSTSEYYGMAVKPHLYHYFDLWFTGFFSKLFNYSEFKILLFVCFPLFHSLIFLLLFITCNRIIKKNYLSFLLAIGLLFGSIIIINKEGAFFQLIETYRGLPYSLFFKLTIIYILLIASYYFYLINKNKVSILIICILLIIYPTTIPAFFALSIVVLMFNLFKFKKISFFAVSILVTISYIIIFQKLVNFEKITGVTFHLYTIKQYLILYTESFIKIFIEHYLVLLLLIYNVFISPKKILRNNIIVYVFVCLFGAVSYVYFNPPGIRDLNQVITNISPVLLLILMLELIRKVHSKKIMNVIVSVSLIIGFYNIYLNYTKPNVKLIGKETKHSIKFRSAIENFVLKNNGNYCSISTIQPSDYYYHTSMKFNYLLKLKEFKTPMEIKILFDEKDRLISYSNKNINYPPNQNFQNISNSVESIYNYLKKNNFKYVFLERTACLNNDKLIDFLNKKCSKIIEDENTMDAIFQLN